MAKTPEFTCETCGKSFSSAPGLQHHKTVIHGPKAQEPVSNVDAAMRVLYPKGVPVDEIDKAARVRKFLLSSGL